MSATPTPATMPAPAKSRRRWLRGVLVFLAALVLVAAGAWLYLDSATRSAWDAMEAELDHSDPRWRLLEMDADAPAFADDENGALIMVALAPKIERAGLFYAAGQFEPAFEDLPSNARLNHQQIDLIKAEFARVPELREAMGKLATMPKGRFPVKHTDDWLSRSVSAGQASRQLVNAHKYDICLMLEKNQFDDAIASCQVMLNIGRMVAPEFSLIEFLIRRSHQKQAVLTLERILGQGEASPEALRAMQAALEREITDTALVDAVRAERAGLHHLFANIYRGKVKDFQFGYSGDEKFGLRGRVYDQFPSTLLPYVPETMRYMTEGVDIARLPPHERPAKLKAWTAKARASSNPVLRHFTPALDKVHQYDCTSQGFVRSAVAAVACERYRLMHPKKEWPASLEALVKAKLLDAVPADPIDHQRLRFRKLKDGVVIYSIGMDGIDNRGHFDHERSPAAGADIGFRLWDPASRRQPPLPPIAEKEDP